MRSSAIDSGVRDTTPIPALIGKPLQLNGERVHDRRRHAGRDSISPATSTSGSDRAGTSTTTAAARTSWKRSSRLAPGVDLAAGRRRRARDGDAHGKGLSSHESRVERAAGRRSLEDQLGYYRPALIVLFGAVGLLIVIGMPQRRVAAPHACAVARARSRGAHRRSARRRGIWSSNCWPKRRVLSVAGAVLGTLAATLALPLILSSDVDRHSATRRTPRSTGACSASRSRWRPARRWCSASCPAIVLMRRNLTTDLKTGERGSSRASRIIYRVLVVRRGGARVRRCSSSSGLLVRTVSRMTNVPIGVGSPEVVTASVQLTGGAGSPAFNDWGAVATTFGQILDHVRSRPGVRAAGAIELPAARSRLARAVRRRRPAAGARRGGAAGAVPQRDRGLLRSDGRGACPEAGSSLRKTPPTPRASSS